MISFFGNFLLWAALFFSIFQFSILIWKKNIIIQKYYRITCIGILLTTLLSFLSLIFCFVISDFSVLNVFQNSHTSKPFIYKVAASWGSHEGSMLLWVLVLAVINYFIYLMFSKKNFFYISKTLQIQSLIIVGFLIFILLTSSPFEKIFPIPSNGLGFNPILQDPALAIHPPLLYFGYVGLSAVFSMAVAALHLQNDETKWYRYMKPFIIFSWTFLTAGITFGSIWAYYELGWGGWWFWDPVENAALMPWLLGTALMHSVIAVERKRVLQNWVLLLSILAFLLSVIGTFLVRSGILTSVHAFALDPSRGTYILFFVTILGGYSLTLFAINSKKFLNKNFFSIYSKEGSILVNNLIMSVVCGSVLIGTVYPLFIEVFSDNRISIGEPYFNSTIIPIIIPAILVMGTGPLLSWGGIGKLKSKKNLLLGLIIFIFLILIFYFVYGFVNAWGFIGISLTSWIISNIILKIFISKSKTKNKFLINFDSMTIAHLGFSLLILGITGSSIWQKENITKMKLNEITYIDKYKIKLIEINEFAELNYMALEASFLIYDKKNNIVTKLKPQKRIYLTTKSKTSEVAIHTNLQRDLYIALGDDISLKSVVVKIYYNPLVIWIWIGALFIFIGGILALYRNLNFAKKNNES